ncbi:BON domain-containing protein [Streptomyces luteogriseus]|uniref:BON domain-containing protein n=1 Tax=Streptomyces luteogriseus TaxID=68233 RepID=UPI002E343153|nr:BON domain-containing protein [Streptomyces luteogriseus]WTJ32787.1 BON domain-containing protein [Streptomyces luteogriseus]
MSTHGSQDAGGGVPAENLDYRIAHLQDRLASGELGELGVRVEARGRTVLLTGTVPSAPCRDEILRTVHEELAGFPVHSDLVVTEASSPDHAEELS